MQRPRQRKQPPSADSKPKLKDAKRVAAPMSARRLWAFRLTAALLLPGLLLVGLEAGLRLANYGHPTSFFLSQMAGGRERLVENSAFGLRFFPPAVARSPSPISFEARKTPGAYRVFLFGESAALGDPRPAYGVGRYLEALLRERYPGASIEVVCVAMTAINSHGILPIARECARLEGDAWIVYMGNNEMAGPFGANTVFGPQTPKLRFVRTLLSLQATRTGQWLAGLNRRLRGEGNGPAWTGLRMFLQSQIAPGDERRAVVYDHFRRNLEAIVRTGTRNGSRVLLSTVAVNLKDSPPFASLHGPRFDAARRGEWEQLYAAGQQAEAAGNATEAIRAYEQAARLDPEFAELQFRIGRCWSSLTNFVPARKAFEAACDADALPFRADSRLNSIILDTANRFGGGNVDAVNAGAALARLTPEGVAGGEAFHEHVHLNFAGNYHLARAFAEKLEPSLPAAIKADGKPAWAAQERCERRLALTDWNRHAVLESVVPRVAEPPFTQQLDHPARLKARYAEAAELKQRLQPTGYLEAREVYLEALKRDPDDFKLHANFAEFLETTGNLPEATTEWERVAALLPHHHVAFFQVGRLLSARRKYDEAESAFQKALALRPDLAEANVQLGNIQTARGKPELAMAQYQAALRRRPEEPEVHRALADALAAQGRRPEAVASLRDAIRLRPSYWEARYLLAIELASSGKIPQAEAEFEEVIRLRPGFALAHLNLGVALARQNRLLEALRQFQETLRIDPGNKKAQEHLEVVQKLVSRPR